MSKQDLLITITCSSKDMQSPETMHSKLATLPYIHWVVDTDLVNTKSCWLERNYVVLLSCISLSLERRRRSRRISSRKISSEPIKEESTNGTTSGKTIQGKDQLVEEEAAGIGSVSFLFCVLGVAQRGKWHWRIQWRCQGRAPPLKLQFFKKKVM